MAETWISFWNLADAAKKGGGWNELFHEIKLEYQSPPPIFMRKFKTGATRDNESNKIDYEGCLSPIVLQSFGEYMNRHRIQSNGKLRTSDNWQKGMPKDVYMKSMLRHLMDVWLEHRNFKSREGLENGLNGIIFNAMGYLFELKKYEKKI